MRILRNCYELVREVERDLFEMGTEYNSATVQDYKLEGGEAKTMELFGYAYTLTTGDKSKEMLKYMGCDVEYAEQEAKERTMGIPIETGSPAEPLNPGMAWQMNRPLWEKFLRDGLFSYTYGERMQWQLPYVIHELSKRPNSRQAMITMYSAERDIMNWGGRDRVPCSVSYQFAIRNNTLNVVYNQRSCDFLKFFAYDVFFTLRLQQYVADALCVGYGNFIHFIGSVHAFKSEMAERKVF